MKRTLLLSVFLICTGCQQQVWYKEGATSDQVKRDLAEVKYDSVKYDNTPSYNGVDDPIASGMSEGINSANRRNEIMKAGMEAKGYRLISKDEADRLGVTAVK